MTPEAQIAAARKFAPPLITVGQVDRRGAHLRTVNRRAVDYARRAGLPLEEVYPGGLARVRALAPPAGAADAAAFLAASGLSAAEVYYPIAPLTFGSEASRRRRRARPRRRTAWGWAAIGALVGAAAAGPMGAALGGGLGLLGGGR